MFENLGFLKSKFSIFTIGEYRKHGLFIKVGERIRNIRDIRVIDLVRVEDADAQSLIKLVKFLKRGKAPDAPTPYTMRYLG